MYVLRNLFINIKKEKRFCSDLRFFFEDYMYYQRMIGWCCPLACRLDVGELFLLDLVQIYSVRH